MQAWPVFLSCRIFPLGNREKFAGGRSSAKLDEIIELGCMISSFSDVPLSWASGLIELTPCVNYRMPVVSFLMSVHSPSACSASRCRDTCQPGQYSACSCGLLSTLSRVCCNLADRFCSSIMPTKCAKCCSISNCSRL